MTWREIPWARIYEEEGALYDMGESSRTFCQECLSFAVCLLGLLVGPSRQQTAGFLLTCFFNRGESVECSKNMFCMVALFLPSEEFVPGRFICLGG